MMSGVFHKHIVRFIEVFEHADDMGRALVIVMEFIDGVEMLDLIEAYAKRSQKLPLAVTMKWLVQMFEAMRYLHDAKKLHRDLKPANILICRGSLDIKLAGKTRSLCVLCASRLCSRCRFWLCA